ncbi:hypothetical protein, partial [Campylobacter canadensis]
ELAKGLSNMTTLINDLTGYYTAHGEFNLDNAKMTNVLLEDTLTSGAQLPVKKKKCVKITVADSKITIEKGDEATSTPCPAFLKSDTFKQLVGNKDLTADSTKHEIDLGTSGIFGTPASTSSSSSGAGTGSK